MLNETPVTDVIVIGGGLAGIAAATHLTQASRSVTLFEKAAVVPCSGGGGKVRAAFNPIDGPSKVAHGLLGLLRKAPTGFIPRVAIVNGQPGLVNYLNGVPFAVVALDMVEGRIREIDIVVNPDKLQHVPLGLL